MPRKKLIRQRGPQGVVRPYEPSLDLSEPSHEERVEEALDHIACALAAIDHNLEKLTSSVGQVAQQLSALLQKR